MTAKNDGSPASTTTARNLTSDVSFGLGGVTAFGGLIAAVLGLPLNPLWLLSGAAILLAIGSLTRSVAVRNWEKREPEWRPALKQIEEHIAEATTRIHAISAEQASKVEETTEGIVKLQKQLSTRFSGMEQWVAKHAVPMVQTPEKVLEPAIRNLLRPETQKIVAVQDDMKALRRQAESAVRAFATLPPTDELAKWPALFKALEADIGQLRDGLTSAAKEQAAVAEQCSTVRTSVDGFGQQFTSLRQSLDGVIQVQETGKERWRLVERQCEAFEAQLQALDIPSPAAITARIDDVQAAVLSSLPDVEGRLAALRQELTQEIDGRLASFQPTNESFDALRHELMHAVETRFAGQYAELGAVTALRQNVDAIPEKIADALAEVRKEIQGNHPEPVVAEAIAGLRDEIQAWYERADPHIARAHPKQGSVKAMEAPAIVAGTPGSQHLRAHNPHAAQPSPDDVIHGANARLAKKQREAPKTGPKRADKGDLQRRLEATRKLVSRPRRK